MNVSATDIDTVARTVWGEARGEPKLGRLAVAHVVVNRFTRGVMGAGSLAAVCLRRWQFSCWNDDDPNRKKLLAVTMNDVVFQQCTYAALAVLLGEHPDPTFNATHYHAAGAGPYWAQGKRPCAVIGRHLFYNDVR